MTNHCKKILATSFSLYALALATGLWVSPATARTVARPVTIAVSDVGRFHYTVVNVAATAVTNHTPIIIEYHLRANDLATLQAHWPGLKFPNLTIGGKVPASAPALHPATMLVPSATDIAAFYKPRLPLYLRYSLMRKVFTLSTSTDGIHYQVYQSLPATKFSGGSIAIQAPAGWLMPTSTPSASHPAETGTLKISALRVYSGKPSVPESLLKSFKQGDTLRDTLDELRRKSFPVQYRIIGPFVYSKQAAIPVSALHPGFGKTFTLANGTGGWKRITVTGANGSRVVLVSAQLNKSPRGNQVYFAACTITLTKARREELLFDGIKRMALYVNGAMVARFHAQTRQVKDDARQVLVNMHAGKNRIFIRLRSDNWPGRAAFILRAVRGNWRYQIALRKRLISVFPDNARSLSNLRNQIVQLWQRAGYLAQAADVLKTIIGDSTVTPHQVDAALKEQLSIYHDLGEQNKALTIARKLMQRVAGSGSGIRSKLRIAEIWGKIGNTAQQLVILRALAHDDKNTDFVRYVTNLILAGQDWQTTRKAEALARMRALAAMLPSHGFYYRTLAVESLVREAQANHWTPAAFHKHLLKFGAIQSLSRYALKRFAGVAIDLGDQTDYLALLHELAQRPPGDSYTSWPVVYAIALENAKQYHAAESVLAGLFQWTHPPAIPTPPSRQSVNAWRLADLKRALADSPHFAFIEKEGAMVKPLSLNDLLTLSPQRTMSTVVGGLNNFIMNSQWTGHSHAVAVLVRLAYQYFPDHPGQLNYMLLGGFINYRLNQYRHPNEIIAINRASLNLMLTSPDVNGSQSKWIKSYGVNNGAWAGSQSQGFGYSIRMLKRSLCWDLTPDTQGSILNALGIVYRREGHIQTALLCQQLADAIPGINPSRHSAIHSELVRLQNILRLSLAGIDTDFTANREFQEAQQAMASASPGQALRLFHRILTRHGDAAISVTSHRWVPARKIVTQLIWNHGKAFVQAWNKKYADRALRTLRRAEKRRSVHDIISVALEYPLTPAASEAMLKAAAIYLRRNQPELALGMIHTLLRSSLVSTSPQLSLQAITLALRAAICGDNQAAYHHFAAVIIHTPGGQAPPSFQAALTAAGMPPVRSTVVPIARKSAGFAVTFPFPFADREAMWAWLPRHQTDMACHPLLYHHTVYLSTVTRIMAFNARTGALRWQAASGAPHGGSSHSPLTVRTFVKPAAPPANSPVATALGLPQTSVAVEHNRIYERQAGRAHTILQCRSATNGRLIWSSHATGPLQSLNMISSPTVGNHQVYAIFAGDGSRIIAAFSARSGRLIWTVPIIPASTTLAAIGTHVVAGANAAAPTCAGGDVYIGTDAGTIEDVNAATGTWHWVSSYPRTVFNPQGSTPQPALLPQRLDGHVVATTRHLFLAPRDALKIFCFSRKSGKIIWQRATHSARLLVGTMMLNKQRVLLLQGRGLHLLAAGDGRTRWRWKPQGTLTIPEKIHGKMVTRPLRDIGPTVGTASWTYAEIHVATFLGVYTINPSTGKTMNFQPWNTLIAMPGKSQLPAEQTHRDIYFGERLPGNLVQTASGRLLAVGNGILAKLNAKVPTHRVGLTLPANDKTVAFSYGPVQLPPGRPGDILVPIWRIGAGPVQQVLKPLNAAEKSWIVRFPRSIVCFDPAKGQILWHIQSLPTAVCARRGPYLIVSTDQTVTLYNAELGHLLWAHHATSPMLVIPSKRYTIRINTMIGTFTTYDNRNGVTIARWSVVPGQWRGIWSAVAFHGHIYAVVAGNRFNIREYDPVTGALLHTYNFDHQPQSIGWWGYTYTRCGDLWIIGGDKQNTFVFNLATGKITNWSPAIVNKVWMEDGKLVRCYLTATTAEHTAVMDPITNKILLDQITSAPIGYNYNPYRVYSGCLFGNILVCRAADNFNSLVGIDVVTGKQLWLAKIPTATNGEYTAIYRIPGHLVYVFTDNLGHSKYIIINAQGKTTAHGYLPGWPLPPNISFPAITGDNILWSTTSGLYCMAPVGTHSLAAALQHATGNTARQLHLIASLDSSAIPIYPTIKPSVKPLSPAPALTKPVTSSSAIATAQKWTAQFSSPDHAFNLRSDKAASVMPGRSANVRVTYSKKGVHLTIHILGGPLSQCRDTTGPQQGNAIVVGLQSSRNRGTANHYLLAAFWLANGRPRIATLRPAYGPNHSPLAGKITYHLHTVMDGLSLHVLVPWALIINSSTRPDWTTYLRANVALITQTKHHGTAFEWGHGLVNCIDPHLWPMLTYADQK